MAQYLLANVFRHSDRNDLIFSVT